MKYMRFSIRRILVVTALAAVGLTLWLNPYMFVEPPGRRYQRTRGLSELREALVHQIKNGDSYNHVRSAIGPGRQYNASEHAAFMHRVTKNGLDPKSFLPGFSVEENDEIFVYSSNMTMALLLIFRDGKLVNHDPTRYEED